MKNAVLAAAVLLLGQASLEAQPPGLIQELIAIAKDPKQTDLARLTALRQLENLKAEDSIPLADLVGMLETVNPGFGIGQPVLASKVVALTGKRGRSALIAVPALVRLKGKGTTEWDEEVDKALDQILPPRDANKEALAALVRDLKDDDASIRLRAAKALGMKGAAARDAVPALTEATKDKDEDVRRVAGDAIRRIQGKSSGGK
jgi:HEAT repeat protein